MTGTDLAHGAVPAQFRRFVVRDDFERYGLEPGRPAQSPRYLQIELTDLCNLTCAGCVRAEHDSTGAVLDVETFRDLVGQLPDLAHVSFTGAGEALIVRDFPAYVQACTDRGVFTSTNTNGLLARRRLTPALDAGLGLVAVSVDGADDGTLARMRSGLSADRLSADTRAARPCTSPEIARMSAAVTLSSTNLDSFPDIVSFVARHGIREMTVESLHHWGDDKRLNDQSLFALDPARTIGQIEAGLARAVEAQLQVSIFDYSRLRSRSVADAVCPWPWDACFVTRDGDVTPCCVNIEANAGNVLGNVTTTPMAAIWTGDAFNSLRASFVDGPAWSSCEDCVYRMEFGRVR